MTLPPPPLPGPSGPEGYSGHEINQMQAQGDIYAADRNVYDSDRQALRDGDLGYGRDVEVQQAIAGPAPRLEQPLPPSERLDMTDPRHRDAAYRQRESFYDKKFDALLAEVGETAESTRYPDGSEERERQLADAAARIDAALQENPKLVYRLEAVMAANRANANRSRGAVTKVEKTAQTTNDRAEELAAQASNGFMGVGRQKTQWGKRWTNVRPHAPGSTREEIDQHYQNEGNRILGGMFRLAPGATERRRRAAARAAQAGSDNRNPELLAGTAALEASHADTNSKFGLERVAADHEHDSQRVRGMAQILERIHQYSAATNPDTLQHRYGSIEDQADRQEFENSIQDAITEWQRHPNDPDAEFIAFQAFNHVRGYWLTVRNAMEGMSTHNERYGRLREMQSELARIHNIVVFRNMEETAQQLHRTGHTDGRPGTIHTEDMGLRMDGSNSVYYPDGSTAEYNQYTGEIGQRYNPDGTTWTAPADEHDVTGSYPKASKLRRQQRPTDELLQVYDGVRGTWRERPTLGNRHEAYEIAKLVHERIGKEAEAHRKQGHERIERERARIEQANKNLPDGASPESLPSLDDYREDPRHRQLLNTSLYDRLFYGQQPGVMPSPEDPVITREGYFKITDETFYGQQGNWLLSPRGDMALLDATDKIIRVYQPDGTPA